MRIGYISFEHPLGISGGGIGTYVGQISSLMASMGHSVEVFSGIKTLQQNSFEHDGYLLNLIPAVNNAEFRTNVVKVFTERHKLDSFDIVESPEYGADGLEIKKAFPSLPLTVKLHTPTFLISKLNSHNNSVFDKARFVLGGLIRLQRVKFYWLYDKKNDPEYQLFNLAQSISSPSTALAKIIRKRWGPSKEIAVVPYPFIEVHKNPELEKVNKSFVVTFIGKVEKRKGVLDLMKAIPMVLAKAPDTTFRFVGAPSLAPDKRLDMISYLKKKLARYTNSLDFLGFRPYSEITSLISMTDVCIFPSLWENFPNVCLEAMLAEKAVIGTNNGGMADMITNYENGILIAPKSPKSIVNAIVELCNDKNLAVALGKAARRTVLAKYNGQVIGSLTELFYLKTLGRNA